MNIISHRGNLEGSHPASENTIKQINYALSKGFDVEVDVVFCGTHYVLGHDVGQEFLPNYLLNDTRIWFHAKTTSTLLELIKINKRAFYHTDENVVLTSKNDLWYHPTFPAHEGYAVLPEDRNDENIASSTIGICTDFPLRYRNRT